MTEENTSQLTSCLKDWEDLEKEYVQLEEDQKSYLKKLEDLVQIQNHCLKSISHQRHGVKRLTEAIRALPPDLTPEQRNEVSELLTKIRDRKIQFREMEEVLPHKNGFYLQIILGQVNVSLLNKNDKYQYKHEYERFKLTVSTIIMILAFFLNFIQEFRWLDAVLNFLLVWYYCTLTIRESILIVNGSRIKGWWRIHHFISTVCAGISLIWPDGWSYRQFRGQYVLFILYLACVYCMQYYYQSGCLYRLKSLGERHDMDITVEGFMSWMWRGLVFLLPFLLLGYAFQLYNAYVLYTLALDSRCKEWQVTVLAVIHLGLVVGNTLTTLKVCVQKVKTTVRGLTVQSLKNKYKSSTQNTAMANSSSSSSSSSSTLPNGNLKQD